MKRSFGRVVGLCCAGAFLGSSVAFSQAAPRGNWSMAGGDAGQTGWQKAELSLSKESVPAKFKYLWKIKLGEANKVGTSFTEPLLAVRLINAQGFKDIVFWQSSDTLYAVDSELGNLIWKKQFPASHTRSTGCNASSLSTVIEPPAVINFNARRAPGTPPPAPAQPLAANERRLGVAPGGGGFGLRGIYVLTNDGMLHEQVVTTGADFAPPVKFLPAPGGSSYGIGILGKKIYTTTGRDCHGVPNGVWATDMTSDSYPVTSYSTGKVRPLSLTGPVFSPDGTAYVVTGSGASDPGAGVYANSVVALGPDMKSKDWYTPMKGFGSVTNVSPVVFPYKGKEYVVAPGKDGSFVLLDTASLGEADHHTPLAETAAFTSPGAKHDWDGFASWEDKEGTAWVYASISAGIVSKENSATLNGSTPHGGIIAFRISDADGKVVLTPAWISQDMVAPAPPVIANGVLVALAGGNAATHAKLYVLDATTGKELYASKDEIPTYTHLSGIGLGDGHAFFTDHEGTLYSFGIGIEH